MPLKVSDAIANASRQLREAGLAQPERDARWLMAASLGVPRDRLTLHISDPVGGAVDESYTRHIADRLAGKPVSKILGERDFWGRSFKVTEDVLDPRPETETLIEIALSQPFSKVLDLGTGSGAILVTLLAERAQAIGVGTDISDKAVLVAGDNALRHGVESRLVLPISDWYADIGGRFDLIVSNPPYIAAGEMDGLPREVRDHDPRIALTDEADGLTAYRRITEGACGHLVLGGRLIVEIGPSQGKAVSDMFRAAGLAEVTVSKDLDGRDRVVSGLATA